MPLFAQRSGLCLQPHHRCPVFPDLMSNPSISRLACPLPADSEFFSGASQLTFLRNYFERNPNADEKVIVEFLALLPVAFSCNI